MLDGDVVNEVLIMIQNNTAMASQVASFSLTLRTKKRELHDSNMTGGLS
ncbi:hypothetical protein NBRC3255_0879 [Gluconobacter thailandicus NBRC 3255]|nr:hypothetical protein NBRC3255_0879 [Gluconobacter thailandicus NBRC 3255]